MAACRGAVACRRRIMFASRFEWRSRIASNSGRAYRSDVERQPRCGPRIAAERSHISTHCRMVAALRRCGRGTALACMSEAVVFCVGGAMRGRRVRRPKNTSPATSKGTAVTASQGGELGARRAMTRIGAASCARFLSRYRFYL